MSVQIQEIEIEDEIAFQKKDWQAQRIGWAIMLLLILLALLGVFGGNGILSDVQAETDGLAVHFERFGRYKMSGQLQFDAEGSGDVVRLWIDSSYLENVEIESISPQPELVESAPDRQIYLFPITQSGEPISITFYIKPERPGVLNGKAGIEGGSSLDFTQLIYP
jgi:hypothetical protein